MGERWTVGEALIFHHVKTIRDITENTLERMSDSFFLDIPDGFNNNLLWNFGHIAHVQEKLVFGLIGDPMNVPPTFETFFAKGTKPAEWIGTPPSINEVKIVLAEQKMRIAENMSGKLETPLLQPFTNSTGKTFYTVGETLLFSTYHEALHMNTILQIYRRLKKSQNV